MRSPELTFIVHGVHTKGGQERSSLEILTRLARKGWSIRIISFRLEDWPQDLPVSWIKIPSPPTRIHLLKNIYFSFISSIVLMFKKQGVSVTIGSSAWLADVRVTQFVHHDYFKLIKRGEAPLPNEKTLIHKIYQWCFLSYCVFLEKLLYPKAKHLIAISETVANSLQDLKGDTPVSIIHHAPDLGAFDIGNKQLNQRTGPVKILFVGAMERKGIEKALNSLYFVRDQNWQFDVVGDGNISHWQTKSESLNIDQKVKFHGVQKSIPFFIAADIFLFPSTYEPYGLVVSEAASYGCSLLVSQECGAMELWQDRPEILKLWAKDSPQKWGEALNLLLQDSTKRRDYADRAASSFAKHDWDKAASSYEKVFTESLKNL